MRSSWIIPVIAALLIPIHALGADAPAVVPTVAPPLAPGGELLRGLIAAEPGIASGPTGKRPCYKPDMLERFYVQRGYARAWTDPAAVKEAHALLADAHAHGLAAADYPAEQAPADAGPDVLARSDAQLTSAMMRYLADLHCGRVTSEYSAPFLPAKLAAFDPPQRLAAALAARKVAGLARSAQPNIPVYGRLMGALANYRTLAATPDVALAPLPTKTSVKPGDPYADADALRRRLIQLGDLGENANPAAGVYSKALAEGVRAFQVRHGLDADGALGRTTLQTLSVPLKQRVLQLELTLERLRWAPQFPPGRILAVNVPAYRLLAFDTTRAEQVAVLDMRVIVGKAAKSQTPLFVDEMKFVELNPYWNVPRSIERNEILAKLAANPAYLDKNDMELVPRVGGAPLQSIDAAAIAGLRAGAYRIRQRPGEQNALGAVKFVMPNPMSIYLHSTPTRALFARSRRDFSHGCIRVEHPLELAEFVLADPVKWPVAAIDAAIGNGKNQWVKLPATVQVVLFYATAMVERDGRVMFYDDIYKLDPQLSQALRKIKRAD